MSSLGRTYSHPTGQFNMDVIEEEEEEEENVNHVINHSPQYMEISEIQSFELKRDDVALKRLLGSGNFGEVYKATMGNDTVAVKSLKGKICLGFCCLFIHVKCHPCGKATSLATRFLRRIINVYMYYRDSYLNHKLRSKGRIITFLS